MQGLRMAFMAGASLMVAASAGAQMRVGNPIPTAMMPPAGLCRVWLPDVAPARQPAPTDCATARLRTSAGSRVVYGPRASSLQTHAAASIVPRNRGYDPRHDRGGRTGDGGWWGRTDRDRDWDRLSDKERRKREKARIKAQREWEREREKELRKREKELRKRQKKSEKHARGRGHDDDRWERDRGDDDDRWERDRDRRGDGRYDPRPGGWPGRAGVPGSGSGPCIDVNRDGVCDARFP